MRRLQQTTKRNSALVKGQGVVKEASQGAGAEEAPRRRDPQ